MLLNYYKYRSACKNVSSLQMYCFQSTTAQTPPFPPFAGTDFLGFLFTMQPFTPHSNLFPRVLQYSGAVFRWCQGLQNKRWKGEPYCSQSSTYSYFGYYSKRSYKKTAENENTSIIPHDTLTCCASVSDWNVIYQLLLWANSQLITLGQLSFLNSAFTSWSKEWKLF